MNKNLKVNILVDDRDSWIVPYARKLRAELSEHHRVRLTFKASSVSRGDVLFLLGCQAIISPDILKRNKHNFVIHESNLPKGRGWSPLSWHFKGSKKIPIVVFEAVEELDAGDIYLKEYIEYNGDELLPEIKKKQGEKTIELVMKLLRKWSELKPAKQRGSVTFYPKRTRKHDKLNIRKSIADNFNHLRIVDNEKYPAWFEYRGQRYTLKIYKE